MGRLNRSEEGERISLGHEPSTTQPRHLRATTSFTHLSAGVGTEFGRHLDCVLVLWGRLEWVRSDVKWWGRSLQRREHS